MVSIICNACYLTEYIDPSSVNQPGARPVGFNLSNASCKMLEAYRDKLLPKENHGKPSCAPIRKDWTQAVQREVM